MGRAPLPAGLVGGPFTVGQARALGLRYCDLRRHGLSRPTHSVRTATPPKSLWERARAFAAALPDDAAFSHVTAALLLGLPLTRVLELQPALDVMRPSAVTPTRRKGCFGHRGLELREVVRVDGIAVVGPADTWVDLGEVLHRGLDLDDLVVAGDVVANRVPEGAASMAAVLSGRTRPRGRRVLGDALALVRPGVRSPMETRSRLMFVRAGLPEPEVNATVHDTAGGWLLEGDLVWREQRVVGEYQGEEHASRRRRSADAHRARLATAEGWTVLELFAEDVLLAPRRRVTLRRFATALGLDPRALHLD
ncbi:hypothetical protein [Oryzobacter terrae]|uniref:hypothetical protein n=1 Tax=Oryzobacter terrae TaxID=1620385 RepID=UPI00366B61EC